ncbi:MAG: glycosyltransferase family 2 protein [Paludibacter sp.]|nr:glycosyltransferase family 2 protein [Paludibacter sp.]
MIISIITILQLFLLIILGLAIIYIFIFAFAGLFYKEMILSEALLNRKMAVLIPGYKEDAVILEVVDEALKQSYASENYDVVVIADSFQSDTLELLKKLPVKLIEVSFDKSTKSKALNKAMSQLPDIYDIAVILDADNLMAPDFLEKINKSFEKNIIAVQGHRVAKNLNNGLAVLDAVSEEINNHIFRKGHRALGLSSAIIGSGMAFRYDYFKTMMSDVKAIGGFDKEIELKMLSEKQKIEYLNEALVYDEKVHKAEAFTNQRRRWLSAQIHYFQKDIGKAVTELIIHGNVDYFDKAMQFIQPPRILLLGISVLGMVLFVLINYWLNIQPIYSSAWIIECTLCILALLMSVPASYYDKKTFWALLELPKGMLLMLSSLLKIKGANKQFLHTQHGTNNNK